MSKLYVDVFFQRRNENSRKWQMLTKIGGETKTKKYPYFFSNAFSFCVKFSYIYFFNCRQGISIWKKNKSTFWFLLRRYPWFSVQNKSLFLGLVFLFDDFVWRGKKTVFTPIWGISKYAAHGSETSTIAETLSYLLLDADASVVHLR